MKEKIKTTSFWLGVCGAIVIIADSITSIFGVSICTENIENIILSICSVLVLLGFITKKNIGGEDLSKDELLDDLQTNFPKQNQQSVEKTETNVKISLDNKSTDKNFQSKITKSDDKKDL